MSKEIAGNKKLYELRKKRGETQEEVAEIVGISASAYNSYETGQRTPRDDVKERLAKHFNRTVQFLFFS